MRVISGTAKGHKLQMVAGDTTRPITDRAKEALFNILGDWVVDTCVLDMFAGTGAVGIEALSRGSAAALFIDRNRRAVQTIGANLKHCKLYDRATIVQADSFQYLQAYHGAPFDLIFIAPPQYEGTWLKALELIDKSPRLLAPFGAVIVQIHPREDAPMALAHLEEYDRRRYGTVLLIFYAASADLNAEISVEELDGEVLNDAVEHESEYVGE